MEGSSTTMAYNFKVVLLGEGSVGKTSILLRFTEDTFSKNIASTVQAIFQNKRINLHNKRVNLSIWDTAGQEKFHALAPIYYRGSQGAILVYDVTDPDSFLRVKNWVRELRRMLETDIAIVIAGNKIDMERERKVSIDEAESYANKVGAAHMYTSAKQNYGVEELFLELSKRMMEQYDKAPPQMKRKAMAASLLLDDEEPEPPTSACCGFSKKT